MINRKIPFIVNKFKKVELIKLNVLDKGHTYFFDIRKVDVLNKSNIYLYDPLCDDHPSGIAGKASNFIIIDNVLYCDIELLQDFHKKIFTNLFFNKLYVDVSIAYYGKRNNVDETFIDEITHLHFLI